MLLIENTFVYSFEQSLRSAFNYELSMFNYELSRLCNKKSTANI